MTFYSCSYTLLFFLFYALVSVLNSTATEKHTGRKLSKTHEMVKHPGRQEPPDKTW